MFIEIQSEFQTVSNSSNIKFIQLFGNLAFVATTVKHSQPRFSKLTKSLWLLVLLVPVILSVQSLRSAETVFINAQVLTVHPNPKQANALLIRNQRIVAVGDKEEVLAQASSAAIVRDLGGRTIAPGFFDAHSHFPVSGLSAVSVNVAPPPVGPGSSKAALLQTIANSIPNRPAGKNERFILGFNYDNTTFENPQHPTREELDAISGDYPVCLWHSSGHLAVLNSAALERLNIDESTPAVDGGSRARDANGQLNGLLLEKAVPSMATLLEGLSWRERWSIVTTARDDYLAAGVTTVQNGFASLIMHRLLIWLHRVGIVPQRVNTWLAHDKLETPQREKFAANTTIKLIVDGSPQGLTAYLTEPFLVPAFGENNAGLEIYTQEKLNELVLTYHRLGYQLAMHGNGDAGIDQIITAVSAAQEVAPREDPRHLLVHAQILRADQLAQLMAIGLSPSFFTAHTFFWGDWHRKTLGEERAGGLSPAASAGKKGLRFSLHADTPVTPMNVFEVMWAASERQTRSGVVLGPAERISRESALRAVTLDAAWQAFKDQDLGSLEVGKLADLVVLSENPITAIDIRNIEVDETWIGGQRHYLRKPN